MTGPAEIRLVDRAGRMFVAEKATIEGPWVHAEGRWRSRVGANNSDFSFSAPMAYTWNAAQVAEVRWGTEE